MRPIDADALIEKCGDWYVEEGTESGFIGTLENLLATEPTIQPQSTTGQLNDGARSTAQSTDLIDRQAVIDAVEKNACNTQRIMDAVNNLPSAQPEREKGEWVYNSPVTMKCNRCGLVIKDWDWHRFKICPNCGADMRGGENDGCSQVFEREESDV